MLGIFLTACGEEDSGSKEDASEVVANKEITNIEQAPDTEVAVTTVSKEIVEEVAPPVEATVEKAVAINSVTHKVNAQARIFKPDTYRPGCRSGR